MHGGGLKSIYVDGFFEITEVKLFFCGEKKINNLNPIVKDVLNNSDNGPELYG